MAVEADADEAAYRAARMGGGHDEGCSRHRGVETVAGGAPVRQHRNPTVEAGGETLLDGGAARELAFGALFQGAGGIGDVGVVLRRSALAISRQDGADVAAGDRGGQCPAGASAMP